MISNLYFFQNFHSSLHEYQIKLKNVCMFIFTGRKVEQTVFLVNGEEELSHFSVMPSSLVSEDQESTLILQPMTGTLAPKDRLMTL